MYKDFFYPTMDFSSLDIVYLLIIVMIWTPMKFSNLIFFIRLYKQSIHFTPLIHLVPIYLLRESLLQYHEPWNREAQTSSLLHLPTVSWVMYSTYCVLNKCLVFDCCFETLSKNAPRNTYIPVI